MKKGFSLVELLVVIGIIGILAGVLMGVFSGGSDSARAARCLSNMKNLANACQTYGMKTSRYPNAGSIETLRMDTSKGVRRVEKVYEDRSGWISLDTEGKYPSQSHSANSIIGMFSEDADKAAHALTNGCLWVYVARNRQTYVCPMHVKKRGKRTRPLWSYLMNEYFYWDDSNGSRSYSPDGKCRKYGYLDRADKTLLFSEVPFMNNSSWQPEDEGGTTDTDSVLQYSKNEVIGANHISGRNLFAHVVFADGHVEKLRIPYNGSIKNPQINEGQVRELTQWLCTGKDYAFDGRNYTQLNN
jgi:prepilin-type N-terminal cleavage/methylation domain-containing protein/prepilin-type processing-associated H-X9-DG protein